MTIYDVGEHEGKSYIVMELLRGGTVADRLKSGPRDRRTTPALRWLREAGSALDAAHEAGIVHRDVKPANMLLDDHGRLALGDFGIARLGLEDQITQTGQVLGTAAYISPEQAMGEPATPGLRPLRAGRRRLRAADRAQALPGRELRRPGPRARRRAAAAGDGAGASLPRAVDRVLDARHGQGPRGPLADRRRHRRRARRRARRADAGRTAPTRALPPDDAAARRAAAAAAPPRAARRPGRTHGGGRARARPARRRPAAGEPPRARPGSRRGAFLVVALVALVASRRRGRAPARRRRRRQRRARAGAARARAHGEAGRDAHERADARAHEDRRADRDGHADARRRRPRRARPGADGGAATGGGGSGNDPAALQLRAFELNNSGDAGQALTFARKAVRLCEGSTAVDPCAYALFEYARALRLSGDPQGAIAALEERQQRFPDNQPGAVAQELAAPAPTPAEPLVA